MSEIVLYFAASVLAICVIVGVGMMRIIYVKARGADRNG
jgi:hypothetical protein